jgi:hypothetical protein
VLGSPHDCAHAASAQSRAITYAMRASQRTMR